MWDGCVDLLLILKFFGNNTERECGLRFRGHDWSNKSDLPRREAETDYHSMSSSEFFVKRQESTSTEVGILHRTALSLMPELQYTCFEVRLSGSWS
jgi:hypothetical protein